MLSCTNCVTVVEGTEWAQIQWSWWSWNSFCQLWMWVINIRAQFLSAAFQAIYKGIDYDFCVIKKKVELTDSFHCLRIKWLKWNLDPPCAVLESPSLEETLWMWHLGTGYGGDHSGAGGMVGFSNLSDSMIWVPVNPYIYFNTLSVSYLEFLPRFYQTLKNDGCDRFESRLYPQMCTSKSLWEAQSWTSHCFHLYSFLFFFFCCCFNWP